MDINYKNKVYDYCETKWNELEIKDGGYYPSRHDKEVFESAASYFNLTIDEVAVIFDEISKIVAEEKMKRMTKDDMKNEFKEILEGNSELPWGNK